MEITDNRAGWKKIGAVRAWVIICALKEITFFDAEDFLK